MEKHSDACRGTVIVIELSNPVYGGFHLLCHGQSEIGVQNGNLNVSPASLLLVQ